jgi:large subunit ribosomal protein L9
MKIVLREDLEKVGKRGDIVEVADGYARNYLIPRGHAIAATRGITEQASRMRASRDRADAKNRQAAEELAKQLVGVSLRIEARSGAEGKLFGSVTNADLVDALKAQSGLEIDRRQIDLHEPIRSIGEHAVPVKLHSEVHVSLNVEVVASAS